MSQRLIWPASSPIVRTAGFPRRTGDESGGGWPISLDGSYNPALTRCPHECRNHGHGYLDLRPSHQSRIPRRAEPPAAVRGKADRPDALDYGGVAPRPPVAAPWLLGCPVRASTTRYPPTSV